MNAFDLVVTVALGSTFATILLSKDVSLASGIIAFAVLIGMQFLVAALQIRSNAFRKLVKSEPRLLLHQGKPLQDAMKAERVAHDELLSAIRSSGFANLDEVEAVILETDGTFAVIGDTEPGERSALQIVQGY